MEDAIKAIAVSILALLPTLGTVVPLFTTAATK